MPQLGCIYSMNKKISNDEVFFCLSDLTNLILIYKRSILGFSVIFSCSCFLFVMLSPEIYQSFAKFSEMPEKKEAHSLFQDLFSMKSIDLEKNKAIEMMQSKIVIEPIIKKLGLQASIYLKNKMRFGAILRRYFRNLKYELNFSNQPKTYFSFKNVKYDQKIAEKYFILFKSKLNFEIYNSSNQLKQKAKLNEMVSFDNIEFILEEIPLDLKIKKKYVLNFSPLDFCIRKVKNNLKIEPSNFSSSVLNLTFEDPSPYLAKNILNALMQSYVNYLIDQNFIFAKEQFEYLGERKNEVNQDFEKALNHHTKYLTNNLSKHGFMGLEQEITNLTYPYSEYMKKNFALNLELSQIEILNKSDGDFIFSNELVGKKLSLIANQKSDLTQKKDELSLSLLSFKKYLNDFPSKDVSEHILNISNIKKEKEKVKEALKHLKENNIKNFAQISSPIDSIVNGAINHQLTKADINSYLSQIERVLITQEKAMKARPFYASDNEEVFTGIGTDTVNELYINYNHKIDQTQAQLKQLNIALKDINSDGFEMTSISSFCFDALSQKLINQSTDIEFKLNDNDSIGEKDQKRLISELYLIKKFLKNHLIQQIKTKKILLDLFQKKLYSLQIVALDNTNQKISILDQQAKDFLIFRKENILKEKLLIKEQMKKIRESMLLLPEKWKQEKLLQLKSESTLKIIQSLTNLIESKTIDFHLEKIASKPIELAEQPFAPKKKRGILILIVTFIIGNILAFLYFFARAIGKDGFVATLDNLNAINEIILGKISYFCDGPKIDYIQDNDLDTLRNIIQFSEKLLARSGSILSLIGSKGPNYAHSLCSLIYRTGKKVLLIELNFQNQKTNEKLGLIQYLEKKIETVPIKKLSSYDFLSTGATSRFGSEILRSLSFQQFINEIKNKYDIIIAYGAVSPNSAEAKVYLQFSDKLVISLINEKINDLSIFFQKEKMVGFLKVKP
jgi:hypothetical protein